MVQRIRSIFIPIVTLSVILTISAGVIAYGRGYRFDFGKKSLKSTGLLVASSEPNGAQILIDGKVKSATPATLNLTPGWYSVRVVKEGFQPWEKRVPVRGEVVAKIEALLLPTNPSLTAITATGVANPVLSPDGGKLAYVVPKSPSAAANGIPASQAGIWVLELVDKPLGLNRDARQIAQSTSIDFSTAVLDWSPDSKQLLACSISRVTCYLFEADRLNQPGLPVADIAGLQKEWANQKLLREKEKLATLKEDFVAVATNSMRMIAFSPDETKILYEATHSATLPQMINPPLIGTNPTAEVRDLTPGKLYVYDIKEDRNYLLGEKSLFGNWDLVQWLPTSRHLLIIGQDRIEIMDFDGTNRRTAYAGPFGESFAIPWTNATRIVILTNLNPKASTVNNLYAVNLR